MTTTLPTREGPPSTFADQGPSFEVPPIWADPNGSPKSTQPTEATIGEQAEHTTKQDFDRAQLLLRRYQREWPHVPRPKFVLKQEWIGRVDQVREHTFDASLVKRSHPSELEHAEIEIEEVAPGDRNRLRPGAVFYWVVGYRDEPHGQRLGVSSIIFRNMIEASEEQLERARLEADRAISFLEAAEPPDA